MHAVAEIVIPPGVAVEPAVKQVMDYFREPKYDAEGDEVGREDHAKWWDWWVIGGRFSGHKLEASLDQNKLAAFNATLNERKVTVSGLVCGKQELAPSSQIPMVDALWREFFPGTGEQCPLFQHARDQYRRDGHYADDVALVAQLSDRLTATRLIVAAPHWDKAKKDTLYPACMLVSEFYNGVQWQDSDWNGNIKAGMERIVKYVLDSGKAQSEIQQYSEWLCVTVDYHN